MSLSGRKVLVVVITKDIVEPECMDSILALEYPDYNVMVHIKKPMKYFTNAEDPRHESYVNQYINCPENRNEARTLALASDADYFLFVDSDTVLPKNALSLLMVEKRDAIGGYYKASGGSANYVAGRFVKNQKGQEVFLHFLEVAKGVQQVNMIGMGCALISRKMLTEIPFEDGLNMGVLIPAGPTIEETKPIGMGECMIFGHRAREKGYALFMHGLVECKHLTRKDHYTTIPEKGKDASSN